MPKPRTIILTLMLLVLIAAILACFCVPYLRDRPGELVLVPPEDCIGLSITSPNLAAPASFTFSKEVRLSPISHGPYKIELRFKDGQTAWLEFFHADTRRHARLELVFTRQSGNRLQISFFAMDPGGIRAELFSNTVDFSKMTADHPLTLDWI